MRLLLLLWTLMMIRGGRRERGVGVVCEWVAANTGSNPHRLGGESIVFFPLRRRYPSSGSGCVLMNVCVASLLWLIGIVSSFFLWLLLLLRSGSRLCWLVLIRSGEVG